MDQQGKRPFNIPHAVRPRFYRYYTLLKFVFLLGIMFHAVLCVGYWLTGVPEYAFYNVFSAAVWFLCWYLNQRGSQLAAMLLGIGEACIYILLGIILIGWRSGSHYLLLGVLPIIALFPGRRAWPRVMSALVLFAAYIGLTHYGSALAPRYVLHPGILTGLNIYHLTGIFIGLYGMAHFYGRTAMRMEKELYLERNELQRKSDRMHTELELARKIQLQFIPDHPPSANIAFYYHPMAQVGGDLFSFIRFRTGRLGILVSDVSGHGVPAAFIASMINSYSQELATLVRDPDMFLSSLNDFLIDKTAGNFVTAFYGVYDGKQRDLLYANAGHTLPFLIRPGFPPSVLEPEHSGFPLAVLDGKELIGLGKGYSTERVQLSRGDKLLLYTDGLTEAVGMQPVWPEQASPMFGETELQDVLARCEHLPPRLLLDTVVEQLIKFRGDVEFEDDVCMICLDVL